MHTLEIRYTGAHWIGIIVIAMFSLGIGGIIYWLYMRYTYPALLDSEGVTTLNGRRHLWSNLQKSINFSAQLGGATLGRELKLEFTSGRVNVNPSMIDNREAVYQFLSAVFGQTIIHS